MNFDKFEMTWFQSHSVSYNFHRFITWSSCRGFRLSTPFIYRHTIAYGTSCSTRTICARGLFLRGPRIWLFGSILQNVIWIIWRLYNNLMWVNRIEDAERFSLYTSTCCLRKLSIVHWVIIDRYLATWWLQDYQPSHSDWKCSCK